DEKADVRDVIATILDLGRKGLLRIEQIKTPAGPFGGQHDDFQYTLLKRETQYPHEQRLLDALFTGTNGQVRLSDLKNRFYSSLPPIRNAMYQALVDLKYFPRRPDQTRNGNVALAIGFFILVALAFVPCFLWADLAPGLFLIPVGLAIAGIF